MMFSDLDGFLLGLACSSVQVDVDEWMRRALGKPSTSLPIWVIEEIGDRYVEILDGLPMQPPKVEPVFRRRVSHSG
jgi:hypothetical protein